VRQIGILIGVDVIYELGRASRHQPSRGDPQRPAGIDFERSLHSLRAQPAELLPPATGRSTSQPALLNPVLGRDRFLVWLYIFRNEHSTSCATCSWSRCACAVGYNRSTARADVPRTGLRRTITDFSGVNHDRAGENLHQPYARASMHCAFALMIAAAAPVCRCVAKALWASADPDRLVVIVTGNHYWSTGCSLDGRGRRASSPRAPRPGAPEVWASAKGAREIEA